MFNPGISYAFFNNLPTASERRIYSYRPVEATAPPFSTATARPGADLIPYRLSSRHPNPTSPMHSFLPFKHSRLRVYMPLFAALLLVLTPGMGAADPRPRLPSRRCPQRRLPSSKRRFRPWSNRRAPETPAAPVVQTASALPAVSGEPGSALAKEGASVPLQAEWLLDPKGTHTLTDVLSPNAQKEFKPYEPESLPHQAGTIWMRLEVEGKAPAFRSFWI